MQVFAYAAPVDMRKGFDGLSALVEQQLGRQLLQGDVFLFVGKSRRRAKVLYFDGTGLVLLQKRLFQGRSARPWPEKGATSVELTVAELSLFLEGCELAGRWKLSERPRPQGDFQTSSARRVVFPPPGS